MTAERQQQIQQVFHDALGREPDARASFLDDVCREDAELRQEVASLLQSDAQPLLAAQFITTEQTGLEVGQVLGHYHIERQLGAGGMGVVYLARDTKLGRPVTLKLLQARYTQDRERLRRFQQEARAASALNHPNLLTIYEVGQTAEVGGAHYIVAEYVEGQTLRELFQRNTMQLGTALDVAIQITDAIAAAHQAGIIHRDIKPENIMVRPDGIVKVLDFGLAKLVETRKLERRTRSEEAETSSDIQRSAINDQPATTPGLVMGTVAYMSPEQARGLAVDARSDLFSLGVVLYELLTGRKPFQGETQSDVLAALLEREPPPLTHYISGLPAALEKIIIRALTKAPAERYQTAQALGADLKQLQQELEFAGHLSRSADKPSPLAMKVGAGALGEEVTRFLNVSTQRQSTPAPDPLQTNFRRIALFAAAVLLVLAGVLVGRARWQSPDRSFNSIAVLPFSAVGNEAQMEFLPEALTENLIDSLTRLPSLRVSARNTVINYKGREVDPRQAGKELQVAAVITGRVQWQAERLIIRVELVDTADGTRLWGEEFRPARANLLTVQEEIAREIAAKLQRRLSPADQQQLAKRHTTDSKAYELYAQGRYLYLQYTRESQEKALESFRQAIALDPHYALAYCGIADVYADFSSQYLSPKEAMPKAREAALKAIEYDESLPEAHHSLALVKLWGDWDWAGAERECKRALELNPNLAHTRIYYSEFLAQQGRFEEALRELKRAQEYDPVSLQAQAREGSIYFLMRQYERAIPIFRQLHSEHPNNTGLQRQLALALAQKGLLAEALALVTPLQTPTSSPYQTSLLAYLYARSGQRNEALKLLRELSARAAQERVSPLHFARIYIGLSDKEQAFAWLRKGYEEQSDHLLHIGTDPLCDPLRSDPRFSELLRGMGLAS